MAVVAAIKQLEERNVASEINLMVWSDRMDLVALANIKGEVTLHRLTWTKAWTLSPPSDGLMVTGIAWRPDGKIIAIAYSSGQVILVKVENKHVLHSFEAKNDISYLTWTQAKTDNDKEKQTAGNVCDQNEYMKFIDLSSKFLPEVTPHNFEAAAGSSEDTHKNNLLQEQSNLNLLLVGTIDGLVHVLVFGCFLCVVLDLKEHFGVPCSTESIHLTEPLNKMFVTIRDENRVKLALLDSGIFQTHTNELFAVALKQVKLTALINYLSNTITTITESWENILLEMDNKLSKYASRVPEGGVTADFLDLLMFGSCSDAMKEFLIQDLSKKGLDKFGQTIEMSYSNIQKLLLKYVMKFGQNITYHLAELRGMARLEHRYKVLGLLEQDINLAIQSNGSFLIKGGEMQQIINHSIINYKAFFRWLHSAIIHAMEDHVSNDVPKMTQQDLAYITEFLQNFDRIGNTSSQSGFVMERLGQYLNDEPVTISPAMEGNDWSNFLSQNPCIQEHPAIFKHFEDMSLIQQYRHLKETILKIFDSPKITIKEQFKVTHVLDCFQYSPQVLRMSQNNIDSENVVFAFLQPPENVYVLQIHLEETYSYAKRANFCFSQQKLTDQDVLGGNNTNFQVLDLKLYSSTILSVLLQEKSPSKTSVLYQVPLLAALDFFVDIPNLEDHVFGAVGAIDASDFTPKLFKTVEGMVAAEFAVSGSRRVGIVLSENKRKLRLYEMEGEEEEDEDAEMSGAVRESDMSAADCSAANDSLM